MAAGLVNKSSDAVLRMIMLINEGPVALCLFEWIKIFTLDIFNQGQLGRC